MKIHETQIPEGSKKGEGRERLQEKVKKKKQLGPSKPSRIKAARLGNVPVSSKKGVASTPWGTKERGTKGSFGKPSGTCLLRN